MAYLPTFSAALINWECQFAHAPVCLPSSSFIAPVEMSCWALSSAIPLYLTSNTTCASFHVSDRQDALRVIRQMESLKDNWDGSGAVPILEETSKLATGFLSSLPTHVPAPDVAANPNGTISLEWENDLGRAHLEIGRTKYSLYFRRYEGGSLFRDGHVNEIDDSKERFVNEMFRLAPSQNYTICNIILEKAA